MGLKKLPGKSPGRRHATGIVYDDIAKKKPEKRLLGALKKTGGRGMYGRITTRHRGGGHKRRYRRVDFRRDKWEVPARVAAIEYDPNRSAHLALLHYRDGEKRYILAPAGLRVGDEVVASDKAQIRPGNAMPLKNIPLGTPVHNIELVPGHGGKIARSAGSQVIVSAREGKYIHLKMPSSEVRRVLGGCLATVGQIGNEDWRHLTWGKAGRKRWLGIRPTVRGTAQDPKSHPHGGGEGRSGIGMPSPKSPWGKKTLGKKTRKKKPSDKYMVKRRKK
jgi:large subunit ribosomal protein L2